MRKQHILIVNQHAPYGSARAYEALDLALSSATFDQHVDLLFSGPACLQLLANQHTQAIQSKNLNKMLAALPIYGIEQLYYEQKALNRFNLNESNLIAQSKGLSDEEISALYQQADHVFHF